jgi:hypothetical protein
MNEERLLSLAMAAVRKSVPLHSWDQFAEHIVADRRKRLPHLSNAEPDRSWFSVIDQMHSKGVAKLPVVVPATKVAEARAYFDANPVHKGPHIFSFDGSYKPIDEARRDYPMVGYRFDQVVRAPHLVDTFNDPSLIDMLEAYLGCVPTLYSLNAWWSFPANRPELLHSQYFHRDIDDWRFVTLFLYLTDVDTVAGPHQVVQGTHTLDGMKAVLEEARANGGGLGSLDAAQSFLQSFGQQLSNDCETVLKDRILNATGRAGTMWLVNTMALHRGLMPTVTPRLVVWARYGLGPSVNSADLEQGPISRRLVPTALADTPRNRFVNRLLFDFDRGPADY